MRFWMPFMRVNLLRISGETRTLAGCVRPISQPFFMAALARLRAGSALIAGVLAAALFFWTMPSAHAALPDEALSALAGSNLREREAAITQLRTSSDPLALDVLQALLDGRLRSINAPAEPTASAEAASPAPAKRLVFIELSDGSAINAATGQQQAMPEGVSRITINNRIRRLLSVAIASLQLSSDNVSARLAAAQQLRNTSDTELLPDIEAALLREENTQVKNALLIAQANLELTSPDAATRLHAVQALTEVKEASFRPALAAMLEHTAEGNFVEPDPAVRTAAQEAIAAIDRHMHIVEWSGNLFYGISLGSVLLLAALGLAIIFGLMGVINMAHGEFLMLGAYTTYMVQIAFRQWAPNFLDWYVIVALPAAFVVTAIIGMVLERTVIRWLYGRPLETLLATWGISLILMQAVRSLFGAQNVEVANPSWLSGGVEVMNGLVLSYNRIAVIIFSILVVVFVWLLLNHTRLGLFVRAITQNRRMADCVGVPTGRIDMLTFGLGAGIAGLGGVALSQLSNVGPDLGRGYVIDSFMVVVLGGVGQLAGTVIAAFGLGGLSKFIEPFSGAVLAKIAILVLIVLFIQKRPQGLFAPKGRSVE